MKKLNKRKIIFGVLIVLFLIIGIIFLSINNKIRKNIKIENNLCKKSGCSGQICVESNSGDIITTCEWREEYGCYQKAKCEKQVNGKCGFTKDDEFKKCVDKLIPMPKIEN